VSLSFSHQKLNNSTTPALMDLLLDIKTVIAAYDQEVWYLLYRYDQEFHDYAMTNRAISRFIELFTVKIVESNRTEYRLLGKLHRCNDLPAMVYKDGDHIWRRRGLHHRDHDLPAIICSDGGQYWCQHGVPHRDNGLPAAIYADGSMAWYQHGVEVSFM
jgi:hypothetical protein